MELHIPLKKITASTIQGWVLSAPNENVHLPAPNKFIPTDLSLKVAPERVKFPVLLSRSSYSALWYKPDTLFSTPKAYVKINSNCPYAGNSPEAEILTHIFTQLLMDYLNDNAYYAQVLSYQGNGDQGIPEFQVPTTLSAGYVFLFFDTTGSNLALVRTARSTSCPSS
ncbi:Insulin-degrading enzyme-like 1 [Lathyrus oleraceus]|uniref:Insulin-degrading enzyme-like 1 n=1 Tax=Pisum sativum TaxID=3888 RepID=A0A9D5AET5_PEA|nr:Insulin-degrading enzyme-like 1 [Pisum sativum]KAI5405216.1 Insulin-degrading enzyme-like 1 [Pisum sativum]